MPDTRKPFGCPNCTKTVKVPLKHLGKRIKCPKCTFVFRAGPKLADEEVYADLDEDFASPHVPARMQAAPMQQPVPPLGPPPAYVPPPQPRALPSSRSQYQSKLVKRPSTQKKRSAQKPEMDETESWCQSSGLFLIFLPLIATVLPLFGLQLRRLRKAGEFAPLAAMFLGLIGVGMICYARRRQGDAPIFGSAAAVFVLVCGIGGFFMVSALENGAGGNQQDHFAGQADDQRPDVLFADAEAHQNMQDDLRKAREESRAQHDEFMRNSQREAREFHRQATEAHNRSMNQQRLGNFPNAPNMQPPNFPTGAPNVGAPNFPGGPPGGRGGFGRRRN